MGQGAWLFSYGLCRLPTEYGVAGLFLLQTTTYATSFCWPQQSHTGLALRWFQRLGPIGSGSLSLASGSLNQGRCDARDSGAPSFPCALGTARFNLADTGLTGATVRASPKSTIFTVLNFCAHSLVHICVQTVQLVQTVQHAHVAHYSEL